MSYAKAMPTPRYRLVSLQDTPYYHCTSRCVRRAFLCGRDSVTGYDFEHRRQWIVDRVKLLSSVFAIDLCAYAVMSNHYHLVVRVDEPTAQCWSDREVAERWTQLFSGSALIHRYMGQSSLSAQEQVQMRALIGIWRSRLQNLSWFMRCLNEPIARMANTEDHCSGRFWESRFTSQALLDERALLACMAYVDLNPVRAAMAETPETSEFTSIKERIDNPHGTALQAFSTPDEATALPFTLIDYLEVVDWAGREIKQNKRGFIPESQPPILQRLNMRSAPMLDFLKHTERFSPVALGSVSQMRSFADSVGRHFIKGLFLAKQLCPEPG
jgi:REP element-mobilizing transposase RayT